MDLTEILIEEAVEKIMAGRVGETTMSLADDLWLENLLLST